MRNRSPKQRVARARSHFQTIEPARTGLTSEGMTAAKETKLWYLPALGPFCRQVPSARYCLFSRSSQQRRLLYLNVSAPVNPQCPQPQNSRRRPTCTIPTIIRAKASSANRGAIVLTNSIRFHVCAVFLFIAALMSFASPSPAQENSPTQHSLELSRPIRPWEFLPVTGTRAALFGNESGQMEAWILSAEAFCAIFGW